MIRHPAGGVARRALLAAPALTLLPRPGVAQGFPTRAVTVIVPNPPGGGSDFAARLFTEGLSQALGQPVVIDNRPGANGNIGIQQAVRAAPDGHTLLMQYSGYHAGNPAMMQNLPWDPIRDLAPVAMATMAPHVILGAPNLPANSLQELIAYARANPGKLNFASSGNGSIQHIAGEVFSRAIGAPMVHVPYRGAAPALQDVAGGRVEIFITTPSSAIALVQAGRVKAIAMASAQRSSGLPDVPTTAEAGLPGFVVDAWFAFFAPAGTPPEIVARVNADMRKALALPEVRAALSAQGMEIAPSSPEEMGALMRKDAARWAGVVKQAGIKAE